MELAKTIILSNNQGQNFKAILNLNKNDDSILRFYNFSTNNKNFALGIKQNDKVIKVPLNFINNNCNFKLPNEIDLQKKILCAVVDVSNAFCPELILSGSANSLNENRNIEDAFISKKPENISSLYVQDSEDDLNSMIDKNIEEDLNSVYYDNCSKCKYREAFYNENYGEENEKNNCICAKPRNYNNIIRSDYEKRNFNENLHDERKEQIHFNSLYDIKEKNGVVPKEEDASELQRIETTSLVGENENCTINSFKCEGNLDKKNPLNDDENKKRENSFYNQVKEQINALFDRYEKEELLEKIIPNSKWVKVVYDESEEYYVMGLIFDENNEVVFISYGMPSNDKENPPEDLMGFAQWLDIGEFNLNYKGYWIVYQRAEDGESIRVNFL